MQNSQSKIALSAHWLAVVLVSACQTSLPENPQGTEAESGTSATGDETSETDTDDGVAGTGTGAETGTGTETGTETGTGTDGGLGQPSDDPRFELLSASGYADASCGYHETIFRAQLTALDEPIRREDVALLQYRVEGFMSGENLRLLPEATAGEDVAFPLSVGETMRISFYLNEDAPPASCSDDEPAPLRALEVEFDIAGALVVAHDSLRVGCGFSECG